MPTLLQIDSSANASSHGKIAEAIGRLVLERGWRSVMAYGRRVNPSQSELIRVGTEFDLKEHGVESRLLDNHGLASRSATRKFLKQVDEIKPDIVHLHNIHGYYLNYRLLFEYLNARDIPVVWTLHDCWSFTGHCAHFVTAGCIKWKTKCYDCPLKGDYPKSLVDCSHRNFQLKKTLFTANKNLHIVTVSDWLAGLVRESFFKGKDIRVIKNGVDLNVFKPIETQHKAKFRVLGISSIWTKEKGLDDICQLWTLLDKQRFEIFLVGLNDNQLKRLPDGISGIKRTESLDELASLYSSADVLVNPTYADTFPTVNLEALACGTPIVTYRTGGSPEAVTDKTGVIVEQGDIQGLACAIEKICTKDRKQMSVDCRNLAELSFCNHDRYKDYLKVYQELAGGGIL